MRNAVSTLEIVRHHELKYQALAAAGKAMAYSKLDTVRLSLVIAHCKKRLILLVERRPYIEAAVVLVMFERHRPSLREVVGNAFAGYEVKRFDSTTKLGIENRIDYNVYGSDAAADDRADLSRPVGWIPLAHVVAEFEINAVKKTSFGCVRRHEKRPEFGAVKEKMSLSGQRINRQIKPGLKPVGYAVGPFGDSHQGVIGDDASGEVGHVVTDSSEIIVQFDAELPHFVDLGIVDLYFVGESGSSNPVREAGTR